MFSHFTTLCMKGLNSGDTHFILYSGAKITAISILKVNDKLKQNKFINILPLISITACDPTDIYLFKVIKRNNREKCVTSVQISQ